MKQYGRAHIFGTYNQRIAMYGFAYPTGGDYILTTADFEGIWTQVNLLTADGDMVGAKISNKHATATITLIPIGGVTFNSKSAAESMVQLPAPLSLVRLTYFPGVLNGYWNYAGNGRVAFSINGTAVLTIPLIRFDSIDPRRLSTVIWRN